MFIPYEEAQARHRFYQVAVLNSAAPLLGAHEKFLDPGQGESVQGWQYRIRIDVLFRSVLLERTAAVNKSHCREFLNIAKTLALTLSLVFGAYVPATHATPFELSLELKVTQLNLQTQGVITLPVGVNGTDMDVTMRMGLDPARDAFMLLDILEDPIVGGTVDVTTKEFFLYYDLFLEDVDPGNEFDSSYDPYQSSPVVRIFDMFANLNGAVTCDNSDPNVSFLFRCLARLQNSFWSQSTSEQLPGPLSVDLGPLNFHNFGPDENFDLASGLLTYENASADFLGPGGPMVRETRFDINGNQVPALQFAISVPEPGTLMILLIGMFGLWIQRRGSYRRS